MFGPLELIVRVSDDDEMLEVKPTFWSFQTSCLEAFL